MATTRRQNNDLEALKLDTTATAGSYNAGEIRYNNTDKAVEYDTGVDDVTNSIGSEVYEPLLTNNTGGTIANGNVVRFNSSGEMVKAQADTLANSSEVIGIATHDIEDGTSGYVTKGGLANGLDTSSFSVGDVVYLSGTTAGGLTNVRPVFPVQVGFVKTVNASTGSILVFIKDERTSSVTFKDYSCVPGNSGTYYVGGFYRAPTTDANLTQVSTTQTYGTANVAYAAHAFLVAGGAGTASGGSGAITIVVSGTSINDAGTRTTSDSETIVSDITAMSTDQYFETSKKWLGQITYTLTIGGTGHTAFAADFNYGFCKYDDLGNRDFFVTDFEAVGRASSGAAETGLNVELIHHKSTGWTYAATGFTPSPGNVCDLATDHSTDNDIDTSGEFAYKRSGLSQAIDGNNSEGTIIRVTTAVNTSIRYMNVHLGTTI